MRWVRLAVTLIGAAWLAYLSVVYGLASVALSQGDPRSALALRPHSAEALARSSELALIAKDYPLAERLARSALVLMPRNVRALRVMGVAASMQDKRLLGSELLLRSGTLSWRDEITQVWLIQAAMDQKNYATAAQRLDAMLRSGQLQQDMLRFAHGMASIPEARAALIDRIVEAPPWRLAFFVNLDSLPREAEASHVLLIEELRAREGSLPRSELTRFVRRLVESGEGRLAQRVWYGTLSAEGRTMVGVVFDGDFRLDPTVEADQPRYVFEWELESGGGAMALIGTPPSQIGETALNIRTGDTEQRVASQTILLEPGMHRLSYATASGEESSGVGIVWRILCVGHNRNLPLSPPVSQTASGWRTSLRNFEVPPTGCPAQRIEIVAPAGGVDSSEIWLDKVGVQ